MKITKNKIFLINKNCQNSSRITKAKILALTNSSKNASKYNLLLATKMSKDLFGDL